MLLFYGSSVNTSTGIKSIVMHIIPSLCIGFIFFELPQGSSQQAKDLEFYLFINFYAKRPS